MSKMSKTSLAKTGQASKPNQNSKAPQQAAPALKVEAQAPETQPAPQQDAGEQATIEQPAEIKKSTAELVAILKGPVSGPAVSGPAVSGPAVSGPAVSGPEVSGKSQEVELEPVSEALTAELKELATELMAEPQPKPEPAAAQLEAKPDTKTGDTKPDTGVGPGTRFLVKVTGPANKVGRGRYVEARCYLTPWRCQANQFTSKAEASSFASTLDPAPGLSLQVVGWDKAWAETLPDARWKGTPKIASKAPLQGAPGQEGASQAS